MKKILVIDDTPDTTKEHKLSKQSPLDLIIHKVDAKEAKQIISKDDTDLIIISIDQLNLVEKLRTIINEKDIPVLVLPTATNNTKLNEIISSMNDFDYLTQIAARKNFDLQFNKLFLSCSKNEEDLSLLLIDIDNFKTINDSKGHLEGDKVLKNVSDSIKTSIRNSDFLARIGGDEFAVLLKTKEERLLLNIAERIRNNILNLNISVCIGIASINKKDMNASCIFSRADKALYMAKEKGKNKTFIL